MPAGSNIDTTDREIDTGLPLQSHVYFYLQKKCSVFNKRTEVDSFASIFIPI